MDDRPKDPKIAGLPKDAKVLDPSNEFCPIRGFYLFANWRLRTSEINIFRAFGVSYAPVGNGREM